MQMFLLEVIYMQPDNPAKVAEFFENFFKDGRLQQLIEFFGQVTKEDLEWRFPSQTFPGTPI